MFRRPIVAFVVMDSLPSPTASPTSTPTDKISFGVDGRTASMLISDEYKHAPKGT